MDKLLTIIVPTYNAAAYLDKGLSSFAIKDEKLFARLEVLIINDGSADDSVKIAQKYVERYPQVYRIINKENGGHGSGINVGAREAKGKYFKVIDADDWVDATGFPQYLKKLQDMDADVIITPYQEYDVRNEKTKDLIAKPLAYGHNYDLAEVMDQWSQCHMDLHFWGITYRTDFYQKLGYELVEGVFYEDQEYATAPMSYAHSVCFLPDMVYIYRVGDVNQSVFGDTQVKRRSHLEKVLERLLEQEKKQEQMPTGGARYWRKKTAMVVTSYYQIMLLKNKDKKMGRQAASAVAQILEKEAPDIAMMTRKKKQGFVWFSHMHISNQSYEFWAPKILGIVRKVRGQRI